MAVRFTKLSQSNLNMNIANYWIDITKYRDLPVSGKSIICLRLRPREIIDLLATDKLRCFAQTRPIIVNCLRLKNRI